jgi:hypothetical protein
MRQAVVCGTSIFMANFTRFLAFGAPSGTDDAIFFEKNAKSIAKNHGLLYHISSGSRDIR